MSTLDERPKRRRKSSNEPTAAAAVSDPPGAPKATDAPAPAAKAPEKAAALESINFAAYLRHAVAQAAEQRALVASPAPLFTHGAWTTLTLKEIDDRSDALARGFSAAGWARGQRVIVMSEPSPDAICCVLALVKLGAVPVIIEPARSRSDVAECVRQAMASVVLASPRGLLRRYVVRGAFANTRTTVLIGLQAPPLPGIKALDAYRSMGDGKLALAPTRPAEPAVITFSTGASGSSRAVVLDHASLIAQAESLRRSQGLNPAEVVLCDDLLLAMLLIVLGKTVVMPGEGDAGARSVERLVACLDQHGVTTAIGAPPPWRAVAEHCTRNGRMLPNVRQILLIGGPASLATHAAIQAVLPSGECRSVYSMTEALPIAAIAARDALGDAHAVTERGGGACLGRILPGIEVAILDFGVGGGTPVESGELGEICIKGARVALSEARAAGPWTRTGDVGWMDRQGRLWLVGSVRRTAHTRFGPIYNVASEALFEMHPRVLRAVVVPLGQPGQQEPVLVVQCAPGRHPKDDAERSELERELLHAADSHQVTRGIRRVVFRKKLPMDARFGAQASIPQLVATLSPH